MKRSATDRILTTHTGSLPRPDTLVELMQAKDAGRSYDLAAFDAAVRDAVAEIVHRQVGLGIDVVDDGEESKVGFVAYVNDRLAGFEPYEAKGSPFAGSREFRAFPEYYQWVLRTQGGGPGAGVPHMACTGPISYKGQALLRADLDNLKAALRGLSPADVFVPSASPASVEGWQRNDFYRSDEEYLFAIADAMHEEYAAIVREGFLVQVDDPWFAMHYTLYPDASVEDCLAWGKLRVEALNRALRGIPAEQVRYHTCYGINMGPRTTDLGMEHMAKLMLEVNAGAYSFEAANPRHEHEWKIWETIPLPDDKILIPGVISHTTVLVEHPDLVAERILRFTRLVGAERVIAGADCGFATHPSATPEIHPTIVWAKLGALAEGARRASHGAG